MNPPLDELITRWREGRLSDEEMRQLTEALDTADVRAALRGDWFLESALPEALRTSPLLKVVEPPHGNRPTRWLSWRPLMAAAAGIVLGMFCTAVAFGYVAPLFSKAVTLLEAGFEDLATPTANGVPVKAGEWGGDYAELVGAQNGVTPHSGTKMWRFLRADNALPSNAPASYVGEAIHVIDLKPLRSAGVKAGSQIEISAWFAKAKAAADSRYHWNLKAAAFEGSIDAAPELWRKWSPVSASLAQREVVAEPGGHWQRLSVTMMLPENADVLVFECAVVAWNLKGQAGVAQFPAHYVDDVRVRLLPPTREMSALE